MRNSQLAVLCGVILASAALIAGSNWWLVRSVERRAWRDVGRQPACGRRPCDVSP